MNKFFSTILCCVSSILIVNCQSDTLNIEKYNIDNELNLILCQLYEIDKFQHLNLDDFILKIGEKEFEFISKNKKLDYHSSYSVLDLDKELIFSMYFTELPIISISSENSFSNDKKVLATFDYTDETQVFESLIGIELRGGFTVDFPKKNFDLELWNDETGLTKKDAKFGILREDDDWILDALYNEPLRIRSYLSNKLWLDLHKPYYLESKPMAKSGANVLYVELFINDRYQGLYNLSEQIDRKQLQIKKFDGEIHGELYKAILWGASTLSSLPSYNNNERVWAGYEMKYPKVEDTTDWKKVYEFVEFVINSNDQEFLDKIWNKYSYENFIDYFIFLNVLRATDNTGKNTYLGKISSDEKYFIVPWDLDGCFGTIYDGSTENVFDDILTNKFYSKVDSLSTTFRQDVAAKWFELRKNIFEIDNLKQRFTAQYKYLKDFKVYEREALVFPNYEFNENSLEYLLSWLCSRIDFLDNYFEQLVFNSNEEIKAKGDLVIFPNPSTGEIKLSNFTEYLNKDFQIYNMAGQKVHSGKIITQSIYTQLSDGKYLIKVEDKTSLFHIVSRK